MSMNQRIYQRLTKTKKREESRVDYMKLMLKGIRVVFYLSFTVAIVWTDDQSLVKSLIYFGAIVVIYFVVRIIIEKIIQHKMKIIDHINHRILSEFSLKE